MSELGNKAADEKAADRLYGFWENGYFDDEYQLALEGVKQGRFLAAAENKRLRELLEHIRDRILEPPYTEARYATQDVDIVRWITDALQPKEGE
jgi:hypothetical protein